ncbi:Inactive pancreatic lipase-related protein 1 [Halotydeus destructor]|nr:Inactive pancreatic lipase-related protein 1 [Halotydeus destructor]
MKLTALSLLCFVALIAKVDNQNVVGAITDIIYSLEKFGLFSFVTNPSLVENYNNSRGAVAFLYRQLLTQIPAFVSNTLRDCLETEVEALTPEEKLYSCLGKPTYSSNPGAEAKKTSLIFVDKKGKDHIMRYDDFVLNDTSRERAIKRYIRPKRQLIILIHGWTDHYYRDGWIWSLKEFILKNADAESRPNMLIIDWRQWSQSLAITKVKMNVFNVADQLATVLYMLTHKEYIDPEYRISPRKIQVYGHSYGGPIAGKGASRFLKSEPTRPIYRIIALDPSDQCFGRGSFDEIDVVPVSPDQDFGTLLDPSTAYQVKVIHTDSNAFGSYQRLGSVDIYINQGSGQPDCPVDLSSVTNVDSLFIVACSHYRATRIMTQAYYEQDGGKCEPVAFRCSSFDDFNSGVCTCLFTDRTDSTTLLIGSTGRCRQLAANPYEINANGRTIHAEESPNHFHTDWYDSRDSWYLIMGAEPPYCVGTFLYSLRSAEIPNNVIVSLRIDENPEIPLDLSSRKQAVFAMSPDTVGHFNKLTLSYTDLPGALLGNQRKFNFQTLSLFYLSHTNYWFYCAYTNEFNDTATNHPQTNIIENIPGGATTTEVKFTTGRCLRIINYCSQPDKKNSLADHADGPCKAFVVGFLKDFLLAILDKRCAANNQLCAALLACFYSVRFEQLFAGYNVDLSQILAAMKVGDYHAILSIFILNLDTKVCNISKNATDTVLGDDRVCPVKLLELEPP